MEPAYTISSPGAFGSGELKKNQIKSIRFAGSTPWTSISIKSNLKVRKLLVKVSQYSEQS